MLHAHEFMSHQDRRFNMQLSDRTLAHYATECHAHAKVSISACYFICIKLTPPSVQGFRYTERVFSRYFDLHGLLSGGVVPPVRGRPEVTEALELMIENLQRLDDAQAGHGVIRFARAHTEVSFGFSFF